VGGSFFPLESLPASLATVGHWTPNGRAVVQLQSIVRGHADAASLARDAVAFAAAGGLLLAFAIARTRRRFVKA
jgi:ABC-type multidrug transport system permease subunit